MPAFEWLSSEGCQLALSSAKRSSKDEEKAQPNPQLTDLDHVSLQPHECLVW